MENLKKGKDKLNLQHVRLTGEIFFGRIDNHTRPARILVTAKARDKMSALDCELLRGKSIHVSFFLSHRI